MILPPQKIKIETLKLTLNIILTILILLGIADLLIWFAANGSGHNIPSRTNNSFILSFLVLAIMIAIIVWLKNRSKN